MVDKFKQHFLRKENLINWIFYLIGFCVACYGYGLKVALLLVLFAISIVVFGLTIADTFIVLRYNNNKFDGEQIIGLGISLFLMILHPALLRALSINCWRVSFSENSGEFFFIAGMNGYLLPRGRGFLPD